MHKADAGDAAGGKAALRSVEVPLGAAPTLHQRYTNVAPDVLRCGQDPALHGAAIRMET
jgi:hypothetical protein